MKAAEKDKLAKIQKTLNELNTLKRYPKQCVRLVHESIFVHGYDHKITTPFDDSLEMLSKWLIRDTTTVRAYVELWDIFICHGYISHQVVHWRAQVLFYHTLQ